MITLFRLISNTRFSDIQIQISPSPPRPDPSRRLQAIQSLRLRLQCGISASCIYGGVTFSKRWFFPRIGKEMLDNNSSEEKDELIKAKGTQNRSHKPRFPREPSFSRWCDNDGIVDLEHHWENANASVEKSEFELPLFQKPGAGNRSLDLQKQQFTRFDHRSIKMSGMHSVDDVSSYADGSASQVKYVPFDIETESPRKRHSESPRNQHTLDMDSDDTASSEKDDIETTHTENSISLAMILKTLFFILVWYTFSTCLTVYNKTLLGDKLGKFPAPLLMNTVHFGMQAILAKSITFFWSQRFKPTVTMSWRDYSIRVVPMALGTALDINLSNASLVFISVTFATMCKSAGPIFLLLFAFAFKLESPSFKLLGIMLIISAGILLTVAKETEFEFWGFIFVMLAAVMSGFRWSMTQILLQKESYGLKDPITLMSCVAPVMAISTAVLSIFLDPWDEFRKNAYFDSSWNILLSCMLMFIGGTLAFFMVLTEYILVSATSAVTVTIAGVVKEAVTILVAVFYFHDQFTWLKGIGLVIIMFGVSLFNWYKYQKLQKKAQLNEDDESGPSTTNMASKYVILEEDVDGQDDEA